MTVYEKLIEEFGCAITAIFGDLADQEFSDDKVSKQDLVSIANKVAFYLDLD